MDPLEAWHFYKGGSSPEIERFDAGLTTFLGVLQGQLWPLGGLAASPDVGRYFVPARFADYVSDHDTYQLAESPRGLELWRILEAQGPMPTRFAGSEEADSYIDRAGLPSVSSASMRNACAALARAQLAAPR
jgi:hypothetical protein